MFWYDLGGGGLLYCNPHLTPCGPAEALTKDDQQLADIAPTFTPHFLHLVLVSLCSGMIWGEGLLYCNPHLTPCGPAEALTKDDQQLTDIAPTFYPAFSRSCFGFAMLWHDLGGGVTLL